MGEDSPKKEKGVKSSKKKEEKGVTDSPQKGLPSKWQYLGAIIVSVITAVFLTHLIAASPIRAVEFILDDPPVLEKNLRLTQSSIILENAVYGPESIAEDPKTGRLYAGLKTGLVCEIELNKVTNEGRILRAVRLTNASDCDGSYKSFPKCGRPLGIRFSPSGSLLVVDAYLGLFEIDLVKEKVLILIRGGRHIDDSFSSTPIRFLNDVDVLPDGRIVITESSSRYDDRDFMYEMLEHRPNGRLLVFDRKRDTLREMIAGLYTPNGIVVHRGKILLAEMGTARILKFSPSANSVSVFMDNLPGFPDNLRKSRDGRSIWVGVPVMRSKEDNWINQRPDLRELISKLFSLQALEWILSLFTPSYGCVLQIDADYPTVSYRAPVVSSSHNFEGGTIRLTRHFDHSLLNESTRFHTLPRHSIVRLPNSDTLIEYEDEGPESSL
ncbi:hypothetical protein PRIPAC_79802 [Pristionchus pacificus]|uniref:Adipocyte plasma membrane-associated protein n=1 Tax=Pristionchus pacificus TaxID=54126 RepID=A0A2A6CBJ0_PRIPA|nr:hypothetical protein PRIPAC_79802 [Pristionchus pacificus]|eukprot:PDM75499.1 hypothetical protein PRIPAC_42676 [Pristionchus pacificus]